MIAFNTAINGGRGDQREGRISPQRVESGGVSFFIATRILSNQRVGYVWSLMQKADTHLLFDIHFFQHLREGRDQIKDTC